MTFKRIVKKNQNTIFGIAMIIIIIVGLIWIAGPAPGSFSADAASYDFGTVSMAAGKVNYAFKVKNNESTPLIIEKMYTSCMCTEATLVRGDNRKGPFGMPGHGAIPRINENIAPGEEATVEVVFNPAAHGPSGVGRIIRAITLENSRGAPLQLQISATVTP